MVLLTSQAELIQFNDQLGQIFGKTLISMHPGNIFAVDSLGYPGWGIGLTPENSRWLEELSIESNKIYLRNGLGQLSPFVSFLIPQSRKAVEERLTATIGSIVADILLSLDDGSRTFNLCDLGARKGKASLAVVSALNNTIRERTGNPTLLKRTTFILVDLSIAKLENARSQLELHGVQCILKPETDESFIAERRDRSVDLIYSNLFLHHKSFLTDFLIRLKRTLADDGALVVGDWHSMLWQRPVLVYRLLQMLGSDPSVLDEFRALTRIDLSQDPLQGATPPEILAVEDHMNYLIELVQNLHTPQALAAFSSGEPRAPIIKGYDTSSQRTGKLNNAGFVTYMEQIYRAFSKLKKVLPYFASRSPRSTLPADSAVVLAAIKRR